jgi:hypothetical protein
MTLADVLADAAADARDVDRRERDGMTEWTLDGRAFAAADATTAEFHLQPLIARAALGTPDTSLSPRGRDWIAFRPPELDRFAGDRASAWFGSALRTAVAARASRPARR